MKILLVDKFHYIKGGAETYHFALAEALESFGHSIIFFSMEDIHNLPCEQEKYFVKNVDYNVKHNPLETLKIAVKLIYSFEAKKKFKKLIEDEHPDIVHINLIHRQITLSIVDICEKYSIPIVFTAHDVVMVCPNGTLMKKKIQCNLCYNSKFINCFKGSCVKKSKSKSFVAMLEAYFHSFHKSYDKISLYIAPSKYIKQQIEIGKITNNPIVFMRNFLPISTEYVLKQSTQKYLLFYGRLSSEKGIITLIKAFLLLNTEMKLYIVGDGPEKENIEDIIQQSNKEIILLGFKTGLELRNIINEAHAIIVPSEWSENCPYTIMEAMACGKPVIGSNIGGIPELIENGETGYLFETFCSEDLADKIDLLLSLSSERYKALCINSLNKAKEKFTYQPYLNTICEIYINAIKTKKGVCK